MKFAKMLFTVSVSICLLLGPMPRAMGRDEVPGRWSVTSKDQSTVSPMSRDEAPGSMIILYGTKKNANTSVPPPPMQNRSLRGSYFRGVQPQFMVTYHGFTEEARTAFQYAVDIWASLIRSPVPIRIDATFTDLGGYDEYETITLGSAYAGDWRLLVPINRWVADALADKLLRADQGNGEPDIVTEFNSNDEVSWYFGTDANTRSGKRDFVSVVLHEIGHGLGFSSFRRVKDNKGALRSRTV